MLPDQCNGIMSIVKTYRTSFLTIGFPKPQFNHSSGAGQDPPTLIHSNVMSSADQEALESRNKRTVWLLAGASTSLLLPLLGLFYIRASESRSVHPPSNTVMFDRREAGESKIGVNQPIPAAIPPAKPAPAAARVKENSSLSFVKGSGEYFKDNTAETPKTAALEMSAESPAPAPSKASAKAKKSFNKPKLQGVKSFNTFKKGAAKPPGGQNSQEDILKNLPPGAENNPEVLKYLKGR